LLKEVKKERKKQGAYRNSTNYRMDIFSSYSSFLLFFFSSFLYFQSLRHSSITLPHSFIGAANMVNNPDEIRELLAELLKRMSNVGKPKPKGTDNA
jgi:hypothetical protein